MRIWSTLCCLALLLAVSPAHAADKDTLVVSVPSDIHTLDPGVSSDNYDWRQIYPCYDRLVKYKVENGKGLTEVEPMAAESWTVSPDGLVWTFKIRKGITFDDGTPLDAEAVRYSLDRTLAIGKGPADNIGAIASMKVVDPQTLEVTLKNPYGPFLQTLATDGGSIVNPKVAAKAVGDDKAQAYLAEHVDGSGPFTVAEWTRGQRCVLEAKPGYWGGAPKVKKVIIRFMSESADRRMALEKGDVDIAENILIDQIPALEKNPDIVVNRFPAQMVEYVYINCQNGKLADPRVRQALSYAVDYKGIIGQVLQGNGMQMRGPIPDGMWGHRDDVFQYSLDAAKAKELLKAAGAENLELTLIYSERRSTWEQIAQVMQANFADIGVKLKLELMSNPTLRDKIDKGDFELCLGAWSPDFADPYMFMNFWFDSKNAGLPGNRGFYKNDAVDELVRKAAALSDVAERKKLYSQAQDIIMKDAPYIFLYQIQTIVPVRKDVKGYVFNPMLESMYNFEAISKN
ncbi:ABC transporter substrate-binding protein [Desulfolutivibrio sulfoxidireducens]|uniref:ABC transporter substrate-binding protein n=1 Tax=Desulfolutivibrio sulfoxidireducens TaxID=2773299 RepID=UPI00159D8A89|nr:ABC transporter substrate-binding protein [Desulfolutivibrio sulfoxidireducens]QLA19779.1 ABC transporter substrate-binding protein [Desulfolutivibrio sulfoxidireducens]